ncbi:DUF2141 domain-containing protein [Ichthyenterobacterium sp. W332]|uniref:DUF2141 domain-containing protein n=1 Tax=Microcosmobacter mediterraneus TaxID=3075607 RepID=A0ABU2YGW2_9FLAO|nr:DUF2141 domain-containing protein [Ichthyenterobacterium sp. W332]MDT0557126.1 DUF2141 domain-containing protein [Ichthyenterobacterium sp. W332]
MKTLALLVVLALSTTFGFSQNEDVNSITVTIENIKNNNGKVLLSLHSKDTFMKGQGIMNSESKITDGKVTITFENVKPGEYAIMALHDENENNRMDFENNGMPKENYGMSNNPMSYGPPMYSDAKFEFTGKTLDLNIRF